ncbi:MAG: hypothetical protein ABIA74_00275 [bacterium]
MFKSILVATLFINLFCITNVFADEEDLIEKKEVTSTRIINIKNVCGCSAAIVVIAAGVTITAAVVVGGVILAVRSFDIPDIDLSNFHNFDWSEFWSELWPDRDWHFPDFDDWINDIFGWLFKRKGL